jgi:adenine phosphoribosyltransferase
MMWVQVSTFTLFFTSITMLNLQEFIREIPDFPVKGILFRDITTLIENGVAYHQAIEQLVERVRELGSIDIIAAPEARGFIFAAPIAFALKLPLIPIRKPGKLPHKTVTFTYELEYGSDSLQMHADTLKSGMKVLLVDDLLATGGTIRACKDLIEQEGGQVIGAAFLMELAGLKGRDKINDIPICTLITYPGA